MSRDRTARTRIRQYLATSGPIVDPSGYATSLLKDAVGYTGSAVAFIQLIAAMDRDGEIEREISGKRTYKIEGIGVPVMPSSAAPASTGQTTTVIAGPGQPTIELDYKRLAQALVAELLSATAEAQRDAAPAAAATADQITTDQIAAERDQYARRLEIARNQIAELLAQPLSSAAHGDDVVAARSAD
ncbi:hypothetical protein ACFTWF_14765 [Rhodococcus sp. NPDC056960]|uniref:hypothetical protein n=1 Tax=Rhodococcus sp. NPDC056960 TaxID=3345982 RepID=UPI003642FBA3